LGLSTCHVGRSRGARLGAAGIYMLSAFTTAEG
jgi:hypothetical protein